MKLYRSLGFGFAMLVSSASISSADISGLTIGSLIDQAREAGEELISQGQLAINDNLITAGQVAVFAANALAAAYEDQLDKTFAEIEATNDQLSDELRRLIEATETPFDSASDIVNSSGAVVARLPLASEVPAITDAVSNLVDREDGVFELNLSSFNLEFGELRLSGNGTELQLTERLSTSIRITGSIIDDPDALLVDGFFYRHPIRISFVNDGGWWSSDEQLDFTYSITSVDWSEVQSRVTYNSQVVDRIYSDEMTAAGSHPRVGRRHQYQVDVVPTSPNKIDPTSFRITRWSPHSECQSRNTGYTIQEISEQRIRIFVYGKEEGGYDRDCGTELSYVYRTFQELLNLVSITTEWEPYDPTQAIGYPDQSDFLNLELRTEDGTILTFSEDSNAIGFLELVDAEEINQVRLRQQ